MMSELESIKLICDALDDLNDDARKRVMAYISDKFKLLIDKCPAKSPSGFRSPGGAECYLPRNHNGAHQGHSVEWHDAKPADDDY